MKRALVFTSYAKEMVIVCISLISMLRKIAAGSLVCVCLCKHVCEGTHDSLLPSAGLVKKSCSQGIGFFSHSCQPAPESFEHFVATLVR